MLSSSFTGLFKAFLATLLVGSLSQSAYAVTQYKKRALNFVTDPSQLKVSLPLPVMDQVEQIKITPRKLAIRAKKAVKDETIEPLSIDLPRDQAALTKLAKELARSGSAEALKKTFFDRIQAHGATNDNKVKMIIGANELALFDPIALGGEFAKGHHNVTVQSSKLLTNPKLRDEFLAQVSPFLSSEESSHIDSKLRSGIDLSIDRDILPRFAHKMIKKFTVYRGPNCFHAALAFHGQTLAQSPYINVKRERGYHKAMINYDELWRAINQNFYEVDSKTSPLKYGDMVVFFDVPEDGSNSVNFRWIRHTATYLFGSYVFSKGSKSPDTPYTVKTLEEEWKTWRGYTKNMGVKVFRRNSSSIQKIPPTDLTDWIY